jgi:hypothetical protein
MLQLSQRIVFRCTKEELAWWNALRAELKHKHLSETVRRALSKLAMEKVGERPITSPDPDKSFPLVDIKKKKTTSVRRPKKVSKTQRKAKVK